MPARPGTCYDVISGCQSQQRRTADALIRPVIKSARLRFAPAVTLMTARCQPVTDRGTASISTRQTARANSIGNESVPIQLAQCWFPGLAIYNGRFQIKCTEAMLSSEMASLGNQHCANCFGTLSFPIHVLEREVEGQLVQKLERNKRTHGWTNTTDRITFLAYALCNNIKSHTSRLTFSQSRVQGGSVAEWLACWTQAQKGLGSNRSRDAVG